MNSGTEVFQFHKLVGEGVESVTHGAEKLVYYAEAGARRMAVKVFREINYGSDEPIKRGVNARRELEVYRFLRESDLDVYTPVPYGIVRARNGRDIGLAVEWIDGNIVGNYRSNVLDLSDVRRLERAVLDASDIWLEADMVSYYNLIFRGRRQIPTMMFAECKLVKPYPRGNYERLISAVIKDLVDQFTASG